MSSNKKGPEDYMISFSDFKTILKKHSRMIAFCTLGMVLFASFWQLTKNPEYLLESSFKEKGKTQVGLTRSLAETLLSGGGGSTESEAGSFMRSRKLTETLVRDMNLHGKVCRIEKTYPYLAAIRDNLIIEYAHFNKERHPILPDICAPIAIKQLTYESEVPLNLDIKFNTEDEFTVLMPNGEEIPGKLNEPFQKNGIGFTLQRNGKESYAKQKFILELQPVAFVAEGIAKSLFIIADKTDKTLLVLRYPHRDRHLGAAILNRLMEAYLEHLRQEHIRITGEQLQYLEKRRADMRQDLKGMMSEYAVNLSSDLSSTGFPNSSKAMDFLAAAQNDFRQKLMSIDLESQRLGKAQREGFIYYDRYTSHGDPVVINDVMGEIRALKQQADVIDIALRSDSGSQQKDPIFNQIDDLITLRDYLAETDELLLSLAKNHLPEKPLKILQDQKYMVKLWYDKVVNSQVELKAATQKFLSFKKREHENLISHFTAYLNNLKHLFQVYERTLEERLAHQQSPQTDFSGIDLATAKELYINYTRQLNEVQAQELQIQFIIDQMKSSDFEISSLSSVLNDSVSKEMIGKALTLVLQLKDQNNRSQKEQERIKDELDLEKGFLESHLKQSIQLLALREKLMKDKMRDLQNVTLGLIHQQISILEKHLDEYITTRLSNLKQERDLIHENQLVLQKEMSKLPSKWVAEKLIDQQLNANQMMLEELSKMVESKNISSNLELVLSAPIDIAVAPILPKSPRLLLYIVMGAFVGAFLSITYFVVKNVYQGLPASVDNVALANQHVSGIISKNASKAPYKVYSDQDLETLRKLLSYLIPDENQKFTLGVLGESLVLIEGKGPDYSFSLADLLRKKGFRVLLMPISFDQTCPPEEQPGLLQYLEKGCLEPKIIAVSDGIDRIACGGISRFSNELICSLAFDDLMKRLKKRYQWIIAVSHSMPSSAEAEGLIKQFDHAALTITEEKLSEMQAIFGLANDAKTNKVTFVFHSIDS